VPSPGLDFLGRLVQVLPRIKTKLQLLGLLIAGGVFVATRVTAPSAVAAQITAGTIAIPFLLFGQLPFILKHFPEKDRSRTVLVLFTIFCVTVIVQLLIIGLMLVKNAAGQIESEDSILQTLDQSDPEKQEQVAIRLANRGRQALPPLKMALGAETEVIRSGAVLTVTKMLQSDRISRSELLAFLLDSLDSGSPVVRRSVLESIVKMDKQLQSAEAMRFYSQTRRNLGDSAERCNQAVDGRYVLQAALLLRIWRWSGSERFLIGIAKNCPEDYEATRRTAVNDLPEIARQLSNADRAAIVDQLEVLLPSASEGLVSKIENAITEIKALR